MYVCIGALYTHIYLYARAASGARSLCARSLYTVYSRAAFRCIRGSKLPEFYDFRGKILTFSLSSEHYRSVEKL